MIISRYSNHDWIIFLTHFSYFTSKDKSKHFKKHNYISTYGLIQDQEPNLG